MTLDELQLMSVGTIVRTRPYDDIYADAVEDDGDNLYFEDSDCCFVISGMKPHCGKEGIITKFYNDGKDSVRIRFDDGSECDYWWAHPTLETYKPKQISLEKYTSLMK